MKRSPERLGNTLALFESVVQDIWTPPPQDSVAEWADRERVLSSEASSEPGKWVTDKAPYQRGMMEAYTNPRVRRIVAMIGAQLGKSESLILNPIGYHIDLDPCPILMVQPTDKMADSFSKERIAPMIRDTPALRRKVSPSKGRDNDNTIDHKSFPGGFIAITGSNSPANLAGRPIRVALIDEVDRCENTSEGDPVELVNKRLSTFWNSKFVLTSTPTTEGESKIAAAYAQSTQEVWEVPCPKCDHYQTLEWERIDFKTVEYVCERCEKGSNQAQWLAAGHKGRWHARKEHATCRGFHLSGLVSPWVSWETLIAEFLEANVLSQAGDHEKLRVFWNTRLARVWENRGEKIDKDELMKRCEVYRQDIPAGVLILTAGVDVQDNRLCYLVLGWGLGRECWVIEYGTVWGDPRSKEPWEELDKRLFNREWQDSEGRTVKVRRMFVDSGGHATPHVYAYTKARTPRAMSVKGSSSTGDPVIKHVRFTNKERAPLAILGVDTIKDEVTSRLRVEQVGPGYVHFPRLANGDPAKGIDEMFFTGLTAEKRVPKFIRGFKKLQWEKLNHVQNEPLDCFGYGFAALEEMGGLRALEEAEKKANEPENQPVKPTFGVAEQKATEVARKPAQTGQPASPSKPLFGVYRRH